MTMDRGAEKPARIVMEKKDQGSWLVDFLLNGMEESIDPNKDIKIEM
jgi:hypothetical protein